MRVPGLFVSIVLLTSVSSFADKGDLIQVFQSFDQDPGWESCNNRIDCMDCPEIKQSFGWSLTTHSVEVPGEIGGTMWQSTTPAYYGLPFGKPLSFRDHFSASGSIAVMPSKSEGVGYIGFFNHQRQEWRPWSSLALRIRNDGQGKAWIIVDYMSGEWGANGFETDLFFPADGSAHKWSFSYDPDATIPDAWPDPALKKWLTHDRQTIDDILPNAQKDEPDLSAAELQQRLSKALSEGLISNIRRDWGIFWHLNDTYEGIKGAVTLHLDDRQPYKFFLFEEHTSQPTQMDRFGLFNFQLYHRAIEFYIGNLSVNDKPIALDQDPQWKGLYNRATLVERDFQRSNFGYCSTNWCAGDIGEIGGQFYRLEPLDPNAGFYADPVGLLTFDDPISFSGKICFVNGATDAGMFFGFFDPSQVVAPLQEPRAGAKLSNQLGIVIDGPTRVGFFFNTHVSDSQRNGRHGEGPVFLPRAEPTTFSFDYNPNSGDAGQITVKIGSKQFSQNLKSDQRKNGARLTHFGLATVRSGGKYVEVYLDDLTYTAKRVKDTRLETNCDKIKLVPYPEGGREF